MVRTVFLLLDLIIKNLMRGDPAEGLNVSRALDAQTSAAPTSGLLLVTLELWQFCQLFAGLALRESQREAQKLEQRGRH